MRRAWLAAASVALLLGGGWWLSDRIRAPRISPAPPAPVADPPLTMHQPASVLDVPVQVDLDRLLELVEEHVPVEWVERELVVGDDGRRASMAFTRGPFAAYFDGNTARLSTTVAYALRTSQPIPLLPDIGMSCGVGEDEAPRMEVALESPLSLTSDWRIQAQTRVAYVRPASDRERDRCEVTLLGVDVTSRVADGMRAFLTGQTAAIDSIVGSVEVRSRFERWWQVLGSPIQLDSRLWLLLAPNAIARGAVAGSGSSIEVSARLSARPRIHFGDAPSTDVPPLPDLGTAPDGRRFEATLDVLADYRDVSDALTSVLRGATFERVGQRVTIEGVVVSGLGANELAVEIPISGDVSGTLYFVGTPALDRAAGAVALPDLAMTVSTSDVVVAGASWILDSGMDDALRQRARWPVDRGIEWATTQLQRGLNATLEEGLRLRGELDEIEVLEVVARSAGLLVRARVAGRVELLVQAP